MRRVVAWWAAWVMRRFVVVLGLVANAAQARAQLFEDATPACLGTTAEWTNDLELADVDGDGLVDILFANGGDYATPGRAEPVRVWRNTGDWTAEGRHCTEISGDAVAGFAGLSRTIRAADVDGDGDLDLVTGGAYQTQLRLFLRDGAGWIDATDRLPQQPTSVGDAEFGDVDGDGDLDLLLADWGATPPGSSGYAGGRTRLYVNDGAGRFADATAAQMPELLVAWSWDAELVDVDGDWDLDALVACKLCDRSFVFRNDGRGRFTDDPEALPAFSNNYEFEAMDVDDDGDLDLITLNDGPELRDVLLINDGAGRFADESATRLHANPRADDNAAVWLDVDADGDTDLLIGALGADRLLRNDGAGGFDLVPSATPNDTRGTLAIGVADLDGDGRPDLVQGQGEAAFADKVELGSTAIAIDTSPPAIAGFAVRDGALVARVHDHQSPARAHDFQRVWAEVDGREVELAWYGEYLWRGAVAPGAARIRVCARDRRGNEACAETPATGDGAPAGSEGPIDPATTQPGGCCDAGSSPGMLVVPLALLFGLRRRRARR